jgi:uncharacterized protein
MTHQIESPCTGICQLADNDVCKGCFRTMAEIMAWPGADGSRRLQILQLSRQRKAEAKLTGSSR